MLTYRKNQTKSDPVREILAQIEERQSKTGLSLFAKDTPNTHGEKLPNIQAQGSVSGSSKTMLPTKGGSMFLDMSAAREKAQARIHAEGERTCFEPAADTVETSQRLPRKKPARRLNMTFPPALPQYNRGAAQDILSQSLAIGRDSNGSSGNQLSGLGINLNPFGYSRRTLAYSQTRTNYVVEWPDTWPLKIMSLQEDRGKANKTKLKPRHKKKKNYQDFSFERGTASLSQSLPSRRKARKVSDTIAETINPIKPQNELILSSRRESNYLNRSQKSSRKCADQLASDHPSPPIPPYPSCEQIEGHISSRLVAMETSPLGTGRIVLPPITDKGKVEGEDARLAHSPLETCARDQMDQPHQRQDNERFHSEGGVAGLNTSSHEKDGGKTDQSLESSVELDEQQETRRTASGENGTTSPCHRTTPLYSGSEGTATSNQEQSDDAAVIMRVASQVAEEQLLAEHASQNI